VTGGSVTVVVVLAVVVDADDDVGASVCFCADDVGADVCFVLLLALRLLEPLLGVVDDDDDADDADDDDARPPEEEGGAAATTTFQDLVLVLVKEARGRPRREVEFPCEY